MGEWQRASVDEAPPPTRIHKMDSLTLHYYPRPIWAERTRMPFRRSLYIITLTLSLFTNGIAAADSAGRQEAKFASGVGNILYLALGVGLPLLEDGGRGKTHSLRILDSFVTSTLLSEGLKRLT